MLISEFSPLPEGPAQNCEVGSAGPEGPGSDVLGKGEVRTPFYLQPACLETGQGAEAPSHTFHLHMEPPGPMDTDLAFLPGWAQTPP